MVELIHRSKLEPHPDNPRKDLGDLTELAASIQRSGLLQNLTVVPHPDKPDMNRIIIGHRRFAASEIAGLDELPCAIESMSYADQVATMLAENMQRNDLTISDQVNGVQLMIDLGESVKAIADKTGLSETSVRKRATIARLPREEMKSAADKGATLLDLLDVATLESEKAQAEVLNSFGTNNFFYTIRAAKDKEIKDKFIAENMPVIQARYPKIIELANDSSERYSGRWTEIWRCDYRDAEKKPLPEPEDGEKYRYSSWGFGMAVYKEDKQWVERKNRDKDHNAWMKERREIAKELNRQAFELRTAFVRRFRLSTKAQFTDFYEKIFGSVTEWKSFTAGLGYYRSGWDALVMREMLAIPYEQDRDKEESFVHELERRKVHRASFMLAWALCGGSVGCVRSDDGYIQTYNAIWASNSDLDQAYSMLCALGYEMSDFEKSLRDKTHDFFKEEHE